MAWAKLEVPYSMPDKDIENVNSLMRQHDFDGNILFQHGKKWNLDVHEDDQSFIHRDDCLRYLRELQSIWSGEIATPNKYSGAIGSEEERRIVDELTSLTYEYRLVGDSSRKMIFFPNGLIGLGRDRLEEYWTIEQESGKWKLILSCNDGRTGILERLEDGVWRGQWIVFEQRPIEVAPAEDLRLDYDEHIFEQSLPEGLELTGKPVLLSYGLPPDFSGMIEDHWERHERYCRLHDYVHLAFTEQISHHPVQWEKIARIRSLLSPNGPSHIIYLDPDSVINRMEVDLRNALPEFAWLGLVISADPWDRTSFHWNSDVMYIRNCQASREFFDAVWNLYGRQYDPNGWADQRAINSLLFNSPDFQNGLVTLPHEWNANISKESVNNAIVITWRSHRDPEQRRAEMKAQYSMERGTTRKELEIESSGKI
jgi:hypothetical protein